MDDSKVTYDLEDLSEDDVASPETVDEFINRCRLKYKRGMKEDMAKEFVAEVDKRLTEVNLLRKSYNRAAKGTSEKQAVISRLRKRLREVKAFYEQLLMNCVDRAGNPVKLADFVYNSSDEDTPKKKTKTAKTRR